VITRTWANRERIPCQLWRFVCVCRFVEVISVFPGSAGWWYLRDGLWMHLTGNTWADRFGCCNWFPNSLTVVGYGEIFVRERCVPGERSKTQELLKLKDWRSELCSNVSGTNLSGLGHEAWVALTWVPQYMKHKRGCRHGRRAEGCLKACHSDISQKDLGHSQTI